MHHLLVDRAADGKGIAAVTEKSRFHLVVGAHVARQFFQAHGGKARRHHIAHGVKNIGDHAVGFTQTTHFPLIFNECAVIFFHAPRPALCFSALARFLHQALVLA